MRDSARLFRLEQELIAAKDAQALACADYEQAEVAWTALESQYSSVDSALSRALLATVSNELQKAQDAVVSITQDLEEVQGQLDIAGSQNEHLCKEQQEHENWEIQMLENQLQTWLENVSSVRDEVLVQLADVGEFGSAESCNDKELADRH